MAERLTNRVAELLCRAWPGEQRRRANGDGVLRRHIQYAASRFDRKLHFGACIDAV
jgi:hypothetical protein